MSVQGGRQRLLLSKLNEQLTCRLCSGYFIDATTIIECLHSFCRSCIVKYLEKSKYCPICEVQVHKSNPFLNIKPDYTLQDIVYKLVPGCYQNEMRCRREFYANHPDAKATVDSPESKGEPVESHIYSPDESLSLSLEYHNPTVESEKDEKESEASASTTTTTILPRRYLRCPAAVTIFHLQKLIRAKYGLSDVHTVDILYKEEPLCSSYTLMDVMYIYHWRRKVPLHLSYRIFESSPKRIKLCEDNEEFKKSLSDSGIGQMELQDEEPHKEWKEVQLKISETGVMSVTDITSPDLKRNLKTVELENACNTDLSSIVDTKDSKEFIEQSLKVSNDLKDKSKVKVKEETEGTVTRSAMKLNASKVEEAKLKGEEKTMKMDTRASTKKAGKCDKSVKDATSDRQSLVNNNSISSERESENQKQQMKASIAGSKINALSAKLQFQPKVKPVNNTYAKKGNIKEKKTVTYNIKSADCKLSKNITTPDSKITDSESKLKILPKTENSGQMVKTIVTSANALTTTSKMTSSVTTTAALTSIVTIPTTTFTLTPASTVSLPNAASPPKNTDTMGTLTNSTTTTTPTCCTAISSLTSLSRTTAATSIPSSVSTSVAVSQDNTAPSTTRKQNVNETIDTKPTSTTVTVTSTEIINSSGISYMVKDMVGRETFNLGQKSSASSTCYSKGTISTCPSSVSSSKSLSNSTLSEFSVQTPLMSIFPVSTKNNSFANSITNNTSNTTTTVVSAVKSVVSSSNVTIKTEPKADSIPPCPDAIPLSMMKSTLRKNPLLSKGATSSESLTKITPPGSKIDDICAKIGENSKEKHKLESRNKSEIPGLLEIPKKTNSPSEQVLKQIPSIHVPIFKPSNKESSVNSTDSYKMMPTVSSHSMQPTVSSTVSQKVSASKKRGYPCSYKTLRDPPRSWNPTLSKNSYLAMKNQAKELQQQQAFACDSKQIPSKPPKIFTVRNTPRYLGNPASGVKPMYGVASETNKDKEPSTLASSSSKGHTVSMTKIDPQTLQPIVSMASSPPYSTNERTYQSGPFTSRDIRSTSSPVSPRNSPVNMLSTSPFIPSPTPNTNPRLIYSHLPSSHLLSSTPTFPNANRFPHSIMNPHSPIVLPPPLSAFHNSLPQVKFYQRSNYAPQTSAYGSVGQPPTVQRIPPTSHSTAPKSPKTMFESKSVSGSRDSKLDEGQRIPKVTLSRKVDSKVFNLAKPDTSESKQQSKLDFLAKISAVAGIDRTKISPVPKSTSEKKDSKVETKIKSKVEEEHNEKKDDKDKNEGAKEQNRVNGDVTENVEQTEGGKAEVKAENEKTEENKVLKKDATNGVTQNTGEKLEEDGTWQKSIEQTQTKKVEAQRNKAES